MNKIKPEFISLIFVCSYLFIFGSVIPDRFTTANRSVDGGDLLAAVLTHGIPHPTGYPTYILLGQLFQRIPIGTPFYKGAWVSLIPATLGVGLLCVLVGKHVIENKNNALIGSLVIGLALGGSQIYWSQAVIVEIYGLQAFIITLVIWWLVLLGTPDLSNQRFSKKGIFFLCGLSFCAGLGTGNHITILLLAPACIYALIIATRKGMPIQVLWAQVILVFLGSLVYLYIPLQAIHYPPINWGNPQTLSGFIWLLSGSPYHNLLFDTNISELINRLSAFTRMLVDQFGLPGVFLGIMGVILSPLPKRPIREILIWIFGVNLVFSLVYSTIDSMYYLIPSFMIFALWIGLSVDIFWGFVWRGVPIGKILGIMIIVFFMIRVPIVRSLVDPRKDTNAASFAENYLRSVPTDAILLTSSDDDSFPLWYYHFGLSWRKDVRIIVLPLTQYKWYQETINHVYTDLLIPQIIENQTIDPSWGEKLVQLNNKRPICRSKSNKSLPSGYEANCTIPILE